MKKHEIRTKLLILTLLIGIMFSTVGCAELISTEYQNVEVTIIDKYYQPMWMQPIRTGKVTTFITHPSIYRITVKYDDSKYTISGRETYNRYKDRIGQTALGTLEIRTYDDGSVRCDISKLE